MQARMWEGIAERIDFLKVSLPPDEAPLIDRVSTLLSKEWRRGKSAHLGSFVSERGRPRYVCGKLAIGQPRLDEIRD
jgi:hypothetical protein